MTVPRSEIIILPPRGSHLREKTPGGIEVMIAPTSSLAPIILGYSRIPEMRLQGAYTLPGTDLAFIVLSRNPLLQSPQK
jgi:hypothetical protein